MRYFIVEVDNADALDMNDGDVLRVHSIEPALGNVRVKTSLHGEDIYYHATIIKEISSSWARS